MRNEPIGRDVESAFGSDLTSNSEPLRKETFSIEESKTNKVIWYQWLKFRIREYMILEAVLCIVLLLLLSNSYTISSQNQTTHALMSDLHSQFENFKIDLNNSFKKENLINSMEKFFDENKKEIVPKPIETEEIVPVVPIKTVERTVNFMEEKSMSATNESVFNAASLLFGASIDSEKSSNSNLNRFLRFDQSGLVILDRPEPPADKAWCSSEKEPVLTVKLAKYVNPISVSYQHSRWRDIIPDNAPKVYDVFACLDYYCEVVQPLVSNCQYRLSSYEESKQEQFCNISPNKNLTSISKVQFRFRENYGNKVETCVNLVRVYGKSKEIPKVEDKKSDDLEICSDLTYRYHNNPVTYGMSQKNCTILYSKKCCDECPECCAECEVQDLNASVVGNGILYGLIGIIFSFILLIIFVMVFDICLKCYNK